MSVYYYYYYYLGSAVSSLTEVPANAFLCILSSEIASSSNFFDYLFKLKKMKWCTLMHFEICLHFRCAIENHRKYLTLE